MLTGVLQGRIQSPIRKMRWSLPREVQPSILFFHFREPWLWILWDSRVRSQHVQVMLVQAEASEDWLL